MKIEYVRILFGEETDEYERQHGYWLIASLRSMVAWPQERAIIIFRGRKLLLLPGDENVLPAVALLNENSATMNKGDRLILLHFLSSLVWCVRNPIDIISMSGGGRPFRHASSGQLSTSTHRFRIDYLPDPLDKDTRLALSLYREALGLDHLAYKFLSFYKIINLRFPKGWEGQIKWIRDNLGNLSNSDASARANEIKSSEGDVAEYLYGSCRCAIAHAGITPTIDPESLDDERRLMSDLPLIKNLSELLIEHEYGVPSSHTVWREHLFELAGFKDLLGIDSVMKLLDGSISIDDIQIPVRLSIRLFYHDKYSPFETMTANLIGYEDRVLNIELASMSGIARVVIGLDFPNERIRFDPFDGITLQDDGSTTAAVEAAEIHKFIEDYLTNGALEIWIPDKDQCIGWRDPFIPTNIDLKGTLQNFQDVRKRFLQEAERRRADGKTL